MSVSTLRGVAECKVEVNLRAAEGAEWLARRTMVRYLNHSWILDWQIAIVTFSAVFESPNRTRPLLKQNNRHFSTNP